MTPIRSIPTNGHDLTPLLVLLDLDDTLCDYAAARLGRLRRAFGDALTASGRSPALLDALIVESIAINPHGVDHFPDLLRRHGITDPAIYDEARVWYLDNRFHGLALFPDAISMLRQIRALAGVGGIGLVTNGPAGIQRDKIDLLGLAPFIDFAVVSAEVGAEKPDPAIFAVALELGDATASSACYLGDSPEVDIAGARNAHICPIWFNHRRSPWPPDLRPADFTVHSLTAFATLVPTLIGQIGGTSVPDSLSPRCTSMS
jgi:putative hydrolase of the HAD superfamily